MNTFDFCLHISLDQLPFKIACQSAKLAREFPETFEIAECSYGSSVDVFVERNGIIGGSEMVVMGIDYNWCCIINAVLPGSKVYMDQHDQSSSSLNRPDAVFMTQRALIAKKESKKVGILLAVEELTKKLSPDAHLLFPSGCVTIPSFATDETEMAIYFITYNGLTSTFETKHFKSYNPSFQLDRVNFIVDVFRMLRWAITVKGPNNEFHLIPGVRTRTVNGNFVTWLPQGLLKEHDRKRKVDFMIIEKIYSAKLKNVEHGSLKILSSTATALLINRLGVPLESAIKQKSVKANDAIRMVREGMEQLHSLNISHSDICIQNAFYDLTSKEVFLGDLEYASLASSKVTEIRRLPSSTPFPSTAKDLDLLQLKEFEIKVKLMEDIPSLCSK